ncbi:MAG: cyclic nucleotide-binding domain-containing protein [Myxococcales bacterium]|nr:cyclic nucleotide-binding domain-containing protein [Myxococcales bacterium]MCB9733740.1 cyclic nucleotide-binding domain-containing protein [Deltaproteobacteria bacterium]
MLPSPNRRARESEERFADGETIVREGEHGREMYVIQSGRVEITKRIGGEEVQLAVLEKGDFFGEMGLLESLPRDANARAIGPTSLLVINAGGLLVRIRRDPTFAFEMLHRLSGRIRQLNKRLADEHAERDASVSAADASLLYGGGEGGEDS